MTDLLGGFLGGLSGGYMHGGRVTSPAGEVMTSLDKQKADRAARQAASVEQRIDKLALVCMAMWSLLREQTDLTEEDLLARVREIDLQDGREDGKAARQVAKCPQCNRTMSPRHERCMWCGAEKLTYTAFDATL